MYDIPLGAQLYPQFQLINNEKRGAFVCLHLMFDRGAENRIFDADFVSASCRDRLLNFYYRGDFFSIEIDR